MLEAVSLSGGPNPSHHPPKGHRLAWSTPRQVPASPLPGERTPLCPRNGPGAHAHRGNGADASQPLRPRPGPRLPGGHAALRSWEGTSQEATQAARSNVRTVTAHHQSGDCLPSERPQPLFPGRAGRTHRPARSLSVWPRNWTAAPPAATGGRASGAGAGGGATPTMRGPRAAQHGLARGQRSQGRSKEPRLILQCPPSAPGGLCANGSSPD